MLQAHCFHWHNLSIIVCNSYFIIVFEASVLHSHSAASSNIHQISTLNLHYLLYPAVMLQCASDVPCWMDPLESRSLMMSSCTILTRRLSAARLYSTCSFWDWGTMAFKITCKVRSVDVSTHCEKSSITHECTTQLQQWHRNIFSIHFHCILFFINLVWRVRVIYMVLLVFQLS